MNHYFIVTNRLKDAGLQLTDTIVRYLKSHGCTCTVHQTRRKSEGSFHYTDPAAIHEGTQSGTTFRLKGKGIPSVNGRGRGDQFVTVNIETPRNLTREQKDALRKFSETLGESNYDEQKSFFKKFKK